MANYYGVPSIALTNRMDSSFAYESPSAYFDYAPVWTDKSTHDVERAHHMPEYSVYGSYTQEEPLQDRWQPQIHRPTPRYVSQPTHAMNPQENHNGYAVPPPIQSGAGYVPSSTMTGTRSSDPVLPRHGLYPISLDHVQNYHQDAPCADRDPSPFSSTPLARPPQSAYTEFAPHVAKMTGAGMFNAAHSSSWMPEAVLAAQARGRAIDAPTSKGSASDRVPNLACYFCRSRKIACGRPADGSACNQCTKRELKCQYPTGSRRGQHKRGATKKVVGVGPMDYNVNFSF